MSVNPTHKRWEVERHLEPMGFPSRRFKAKTRFSIAHTPAGILHYPLGFSSNGKFLRPLSIDGIAYHEKKVVIIGMITPLSSYTVELPMKPAVADLGGAYIHDGEMLADGDPFGSTFASDEYLGRIALLHHTSSQSSEAIRASGVFLPSRWNFQGTTELPEPHHIYLTDLPSLELPIDWASIGMSPEGSKVAVLTDAGAVDERASHIADSTQRTKTIKLWVDWTMLAPNPVILHGPDSNVRGGKFGSFSWWEIFYPSIFRVAVRPGGRLPIRPRKTALEYILDKGPDFRDAPGFIGALGNDRDSLVRACSEVSGTPTRPPRPADSGESDPEWMAIARQSALHLAESVFGSSIP